jgi:hypothetical protein
MVTYTKAEVEAAMDEAVREGWLTKQWDAARGRWTYQDTKAGLTLLFVLDCADWNDVYVKVHQQLQRLYAQPTVIA